MNQSINYEGDAGFHRVMSDLGVNYALAPVHRIAFEIDDAGIQKLADHYQDRIFRTLKWCEHDKLVWTTLLLRFDDNAFVIANGEGRNRAEVIAPDSGQAAALYEQIQQLLLQGKDKPSVPAFYMLRFDYGEFSTDPIENVPEPVEDDFLRLCYGNDIINWISGFGEKTLSRAGGLTIFDGPPGTGKTSLIMQMIRRLEKTHVFYALPVSQDGALSTPELVPFWQKQNARHADRVKVIVLEDAERLLLRRGGDNREAVSSLLNIADGLMGRMLRLHVICSVNARMQDIDSAVLRPGRLMNHRQFHPLSREAARKIAERQNVTFEPSPDRENFTLAEVLNPGSYEPPHTAPSIGFQVDPRN